MRNWNNNTSNYAGRTVDLLLLKTVEEAPAVRQRVSIDISDVAGEPMIASGVEKLVQRFALCFINALGSTKFRDDHGTNMIPDVGTGKVFSLATLKGSAAEANLMARKEVMLGDIDLDTPDDERLVDSDVDDLEFDSGKSYAMVSITLTTAAGKSYKYIIPVAVGVRG